MRANDKLSPSYVFLAYTSASNSFFLLKIFIKIPVNNPIGLKIKLNPIRPKYPEIAQEAGIEGTVVVQVFVDDKGRVKDTVILKGIPNTGLDEAASDAIRQVRFRPAKQRERAVGVWISIPVNFRLKS